LVACLILGETVNNMTLAGIIIVLGIVVDDAIIVAENVSRKKDPIGATMEVLSPIIASVLTTIAAFIPLLFFSGRFGLLIAVIPTVVGLMLFASLVESFFILPAHMAHDLPAQKFLGKFFAQNSFSNWRENFIHRAESCYAYYLEKILHWRGSLIVVFVLILLGAAWRWQNTLNYVMFPREEGYVFS